MKKELLYSSLIVILLAALLIIIAIDQAKEPEFEINKKCGDGACSRGEDCCADCGCVSGECDSTVNECISVCGDGVCDADDCCDDCGCESGSICDPISQKCIYRGIDKVCGNGVCDFGENSANCCEDCRYCEAGTHCDLTIQKCVVDSVDIDNEKAIQQYKIYLIKEGFASDWIERYEWSVTPDTQDGKPVVKICNVLPIDKDDVSDLTCARLNNKYEIISFERYW